MNRRALWVVLGLAGAVAAVASTTGALWIASRRAPTDAASNDAASALRAISVPTAPLPDALPVVGAREPRDRHGYPQQHVDRTALLALLRSERYAALTEHVETLQAGFESDWRDEQLASEAMYTFQTADPALTARLDAWVASGEGSFAPHLARCAHWNAIGSARRGGARARETTRAQFAGMEEAFARARVDCERAIALRPGLVAAHQRLLVMAHVSSEHAEADAQLTTALRSCPECFVVRATHIHYLAPRWGGSFERMQAFARESAERAPGNTRLTSLASFELLERCRVSREAGDLDAALASCTAALDIGDEMELFQGRARVQLAREQHDLALADVDRALALAPFDPPVRVIRARILHAMGRWPDAVSDLVVAARVDPADDDVIAMVESFRPAMRRVVFEAASRGEVDLGVARAAELGVDAAELEAWRRSAASVQTAAVEALRAPDDLDAHRRLDAALVEARRPDLVLEMWSRYLARHPDDGLAYLERGGTYFHLRDFAASERDASRACELGVSEGCARAAQVRAMRPAAP